MFSELDLFRIFVEPEYDGIGGGVLDLAIVTEELSRACGGIALTVAATALGTFPIIISGSEQQKKKYQRENINQEMPSMVICR